MWKSVEYRGVHVYYTDALHGGGLTFGQAYVSFLRSRLGPVERVFEWCAGPGFIGFSLLANGLCSYLDLADINPEAVAAARRTIKDNGLDDRVNVYLSDCLDAIPADRTWDLVVGNPPHVNSSEPLPDQTIGPALIYMDTDWAIHRRFYRSVLAHLARDGSVIIQENGRFSRPEEFYGMVEDGGLGVVGAYGAGGRHDGFYFLWSRRADGHAAPGTARPLARP